MRTKLIVAVVIASFVTAAPVASYQGLEADYATCTTGQGKVDNTKVVAACSRLIKNAQKENATIGLFYALRASANNDKASNCRNARKARSLVKDSNLTSALDALKPANC